MPNNETLIWAANELFPAINSRKATETEERAWNAIVDLLQDRLGDEADAYVLFPE
jgi:hypothetical protein